MLNSGDHGVVIATEDYDGVTIRKSDVGLWFSLFYSEESRGYYVRDQHLPDIFPPVGDGTSFVGGTSMVLTKDFGAFVGHFQGEVVKMVITKV